MGICPLYRIPHHLHWRFHDVVLSGHRSPDIRGNPLHRSDSLWSLLHGNSGVPQKSPKFDPI